MESQIYIAHPKTQEEQNALKAFLEALKIKFEVSEEKQYNSEFVKKIIESKKQVEKGKTTKVEAEELDEFLGL